MFDHSQTGGVLLIWDQHIYPWPRLTGLSANKPLRVLLMCVPFQISSLGGYQCLAKRLNAILLKKLIFFCRLPVSAL